MASMEFIFSRGLKLEYILNDTRAAAIWLHLLQKMQPQWLLWNRQNGHHGFAAEVEIRRSLLRLQQVTSLLGLEISNEINRDNWHTELNRLHTHFPAVWGIQKLTRREFQLYHELNLTIHWLEYELANFYDGREQFLINLDFNHHAPAYDLKQPVPRNELAHYSPTLEFGNLHLHYIYIGRHFLEMADAEDFIAPSTHFRPQWEFNATCGLVFSEPQDSARVLDRLRDYFNRRGGKAFFGYEFDDKHLAKGFLPIGRLANFYEFNSKSSRDALREQVRQQKIIGWKIHPDTIANDAVSALFCGEK